MKDVLAVLPARWGASRFPGKLLAELDRRPVLEHTWRAANEAFTDVLIATDDDRIARVAEEFGARVVNTASDHTCGTERVCEAARGHPARVVVNVQGDEPGLRPADLVRVAQMVRDDEVPVATLAFPIGRDAAADPNRVKVVWNDRGDALYFSRSPIPFPRDGDAASWFQHVGVYAFRRDVLDRFAALGPSPLEQIEKLEQLRLLQAGIPIRVLTCAPMRRAIDAPADLVG
jgi:3-deoxy-manno-octulosonate cytidylyltransferase (CMP-KDO synthetase)